MSVTGYSALLALMCPFHDGVEYVPADYTCSQAVSSTKGPCGSLQENNRCMCHTFPMRAKHIHPGQQLSTVLPTQFARVTSSRQHPLAPAVKHSCPVVKTAAAECCRLVMAQVQMHMQVQTKRKMKNDSKFHLLDSNFFTHKAKCRWSATIH